MTKNPFTLEGKTILVTGASSGIGKSAAVECAKMGARLILTARNGQRLSEVLSSLEGEGHEMRICDLSDENAIIGMTDSLPELDGVVNNAGYTKLAPLKFIDGEAFTDMFKVDALAPALILKYLVKKKKLRRGASVVFTSSIAAQRRVSPGNLMYAGCKGAMNSFVLGAARELAEKNIRVNAVSPAMVDTGILDSGVVTKEQMEADLQRYPLKRYGKPEDVAYAMIYLLSDASSWVTGTNMVLDGGSNLY